MLGDGAGRAEPAAGRPTASCATTTTGSRSRPAPRRWTTRSRCTTRQHYELVNWRRGRRPSRTTGGSSRQRPGRAARGGPGGVRRDPRRGAALVPRGAASTGCASTTRTGWPTRPATWSGSGRGLDGAWTVVEKILEPGEQLPATGRSPAPPGTTRWPRSTACWWTRPARPRSTALDDRLTGGQRRPGRRWCTTASATSPTGMLHAEVRRLAARWPGRRLARAVEDALAELLACFPVYRSYLPAGPEHLRRGRWPRPRRRARPTWPTLDALVGRLRRPGRRAGRAVPADHRRGDGQGRRGHRVLPVDPARRAQRGRRRPGPVRAAAGGVPRRAGRPAATGARPR